MATSPNRSHVGLFKALIIILFAIILIRLATLMLKGTSPRRTYEDPPVAEEVQRGTIVDRNQRILAIQTPYWGVYFHLSTIDDLGFVAEVVAPYVQMSADQIIDRAKGYTTYAQIKERIDEESAQALIQTIAKNRLTAQVSVEKRKGRTWPAHFHGVQTIGFTNTSGEGIEGIELSQERYLNPWPEVGEQLITYGDEITLTLDLDIQYAVDVQLQQIAHNWEIDYGAAIVLDARSGDILALGSWPWYDANRYGQSTEAERRNHAVNQLSEPGSVFKLFSIASILKAGEADFSEPFTCTGSYTFNAGGSRVTIGCSDVHGQVDVPTMISKSCNGAISHWALQTDPEAFLATLEQLGFTSSWDIDLPSRARSNIAPLSTWSARSQPTIAFGQELLTSALHLAVAATALSPSGDLLVPHLILRRRSGTTGEILYERTREVAAHVLEPEQSALIRKGMLMASEEGTGTLVQVEGIPVGIKTGTAQILNPETRSYEDGTLYASSLALVPIEDPKYIIYVGAGNPKGQNLWGANIAAPAIREIISSLASQGKLISLSK
ncbi:MAG: penicillin-binding protein 2 [Sphaerochaeta sp.]|jgi:cell division protein FtsI (penicillin-binding protein 3)|nr:penicillin-binding protein 2 [Spirochaetales bacterium]